MVWEQNQENTTVRLQNATRNNKMFLNEIVYFEQSSIRATQGFFFQNMRLNLQYDKKVLV